MKNKSKTGGKNLNRGRRKWFHKGEFIGLDIQSVIMTVLTMLTIAVTVVMGLLIYNRFKLSVKETNISSTEGIVDSVVEKMNSDLYGSQSSRFLSGVKSRTAMWQCIIRLRCRWRKIFR